MPWSSPLHFLLLLCTSGLTLLLPLMYVGFVLGLGAWLGWTSFNWIQHLALSSTLIWTDFVPLSYLFSGWITWMFMLRPLLFKEAPITVSMQATEAMQPQLFALIDELCWHLRVPPPEEVWLDSTIGIRSGLKGGMAGLASEDLVLHIGLPFVSVVGAREFAALLARELAFSSGGLGATFTHVVRELNGWFYRALHERDPWELHLQQPREKENRLQRIIRHVAWVWMAVAKTPFALLVLVSRLISLAALHRLGTRADRVGINLIGSEGWSRVQYKLNLLDQAWKAGEAEINRGLAQHRLPENLALLLARHVARAARAHPESEPTASSHTSSRPPIGAEILAQLPGDAPAASLLRQFVDLARQVTYFYYQHQLGITLHEHRLVAEEEVIHQNRREDASLAVIRRYFGGLAHPERAMFGLCATHAISPGKKALVEEIKQTREEMKSWGSRHKLALHEWNIAWQRRRDLEAAAVLSLAGFCVSRIQFGTEDTTPMSFRNEASRQRMLMEHLEGTLTPHEAQMEKRFASALGLLWWSEPEELDEVLRNRRADLSAWVAIYEAMAGALPSFRELLTNFFAFQTLGARYANMEDTSSFFNALQYIVPKMTNLARQIMATLDGAVYPFAPNQGTIPLTEYLLPGQLPESINISMDPGRAVDIRAMSAKMAAEASEVIAPFVDRFLQLYHRSFAWLAEAAERTEMQFLGPLSLGSDIELLMPEEFARLRQTGLLKSDYKINLPEPPAPPTPSPKFRADPPGGSLLNR